MVAMTKAQWDAEAARLLVNNTTGDIEADEVQRLLQDLSDSIEFTPSPDPPEIRSFTIQGQSTTVNPGTSLTGTKTFLFNITNPGGVTGNLTITQDAANLSTTVDPTASSVNLAINNVTLNAGQSTVFEMSGTGIAVNRQFTITARTDDDFLYFGTQPTNVASSFNPLSESRTPFSAGSQSFVIPSFTGNEYLVIAQKASESAITEIIIDSVNQFDAFTITPNAFLVNSEQFNAYVSNNALLDSQLAGETVTILR